MRWIPRLPGLGEWGRVVDYRRVQLAKLKNVEFIPRTRLEASDVLGYGAELVVIATGSSWARDGLNAFTRAPIPGADASLPYVLTPEQLMVEGKEPPGERVVVYDCDGYFMGVSLAEKLARQGRHVTIVTPHHQIGPFLFFTGEGGFMNRTLLELGVELITEHVIDDVQPGGIEGHCVFATSRSTRWTTDTVVLTTQRRSIDNLYHELRSDREALECAEIAGLYRIGDCVAPRMIADAIFDGHRLAREIDSDDPASPLPYIREHRILRASENDYDLSQTTRRTADLTDSFA
jgi:dimethylamine/trimethylamine dehydrogenase